MSDKSTIIQGGDSLFKGKKIAVVGNGCASVECLKALRKNGYNGEIHIFSEGRLPVYNPMLTTYYVSGKIEWSNLFPYGNDYKIFEEYGADIHLGSPVVELNAEERVVKNQENFELKYDQCLIASGAKPFLPPIPGINSNRVYTMRTVEDAVRLKKTMEQRPKKALVIGASMVGIKLVEIFCNAGMEVCLADLGDHIFPLAAHPECGQIIEERLKSMGIKLRFSSGIKKLEETPGGIKAYFENSSETEESEVVIICIGVRANIDFIDRNQIEVKQGVLVDDQMRTNVQGIYAAGDVAQGKNLLSGGQQVIGLWANARYQGRTAGRNMAGVPASYPGNILHNITHFMGMDFVGIGDVREYTRMEKKYDGRRFIQLFWKDEFLSGANFIDVNTESGVVKNEIVKKLVQNRAVTSNTLSDIQNLVIKDMYDLMKNMDGCK